MDIHIGQEIKKTAKANDIGATKLAELTHQTRANVNNIFTRKTIDVELLYNISRVLSFDFFSQYSKKLRGEGVKNQLDGQSDSDVENLREKLELQTANAIYQQKYIHLLEEKLESLGYKIPEVSFTQTSMRIKRDSTVKKKQ